MDAARDGNLVEVRRMIAEGVNVNDKDSDGDTALVYATIVGDEGCANALIAAGADLTVLARLTESEEPLDRMNAALLSGCRYNVLAVVKATLEHGADSNYAHPKTGVTPLMEAVREVADMSIINALLIKGASVSAVDRNGWNVFMWFAEQGSGVDAMALLLTAAGPLLAPKHKQVAVQKIQAVWRGYTMRSTHHAATMLMQIMKST